MSLVTAGYITFLGLTAWRHPTPKRDTPPVAADVGLSAGSRHGEARAIEALVTNIQSLVERHGEAQKALDMASALINDNQLGSAAARLEALLASGMRFNPIRIQLARIYLLQKRFDESARLLMDVLATQPDTDAARLLLARVLLEAHHWKPALTVTKWILAKDPYNSEAHDLAACAYIGMKQPGWAIPHLRKLVTLLRDDPDVSGRLAEAYMMLEEYDEAVAILSDLLQENSRDASLYYRLAVCLLHTGQEQRAAEVLARASERFGRSFVASWIHSREFAAVRDHPLFRKLVEEPAGNNPPRP